MSTTSLSRYLVASFRRIRFYWRSYGGFHGTCRKIRHYIRYYGVRGLIRKLLFILRISRSPVMLPAGPPNQMETDLGGMVLLENVDTGQAAPPSICVHLHLFYADLAEEFCDCLRHIPFSWTLFVSVTTPEDAAIAHRVFKDLMMCERCEVKVVENRGRDMAAFFCTFGEEIKKYDIVGHFHTKKSLYASQIGNLWRNYLLQGLLGPPSAVRSIMSLFQQDTGLGLVYPQTFYTVPFWGHHFLANRARMTALSEQMGFPGPDDEMFDFPAGSMFWARTAALRPLLDLGLRLQDFEPEAGQMDGTLAHALERMIGHTATQTGYAHAILRMADNPQMLRWGLDQCQDLETRLRDSLIVYGTRLVIFDIFDTLLVRPLRHAEDMKKLVAERLSAEDKDLYRRFRVRAETQARIRYQKDVSIDDIFAVLADLAGISADRAAKMQQMETRLEIQSVSAHAPALALLSIVREKGIRVVYASDMFLKQETIMDMLRGAGVPEPDHLYLSNAINKRKDTGEMYPHILSAEGVDVKETLMIGDNLRSDIQMTADMGMPTLTLLHMPDMLKSSPRTCALGQESFDTVPETLAIGLVLRYLRQKARPLDVFAPFGFFQDFYGIGYAILGPILTGFSAWLANQAKEKGIATFYFLARDGKIMRHAYEAWRQQTGQGPPSVYLEVSRRAVSVPTIETLDDLMDILGPHFTGRSCRMLFRERLGIALSEEDVRQLKSQNVWPDLSDPDMSWPEKADQVRCAAERLWPRIRAHACEERIAALAYLQSMGLMEEDRGAGLVDVGYTGSIQRSISHLLGGRSLQGFYLLVGAAFLGQNTCYTDMAAYIAENSSPVDPFMMNSFKMEKLLSADEGQVVCYRQTEAGQIVACRREFSDEERQYNAAREQLRAGLDAFVQDAGRIRETLCPDFCPPHPVAASMWLQLGGLDVLDQTLLLDDFYCAGSLV